MSDDIIYRKAAIKAVTHSPIIEVQPAYMLIDKADVLKNLVMIPSAQRTGRWIRKSNWMWTCSCCGSDNAYAYKADDAYEPTVLQDFFCPNCGARMEGE